MKVLRDILTPEELAEFKKGMIEIIEPVEAGIDIMINAYNKMEKKASNLIKRAILVIEDSQVVRAITTNKLSQIYPEYSIFSAEDGDTGLDAIKQIKDKGYYIEFLLVDIEMPIMNGIEFVEKLTCGWNIIFFSSNLSKYRDEIINKFSKKHYICLLEKSGDILRDIITINKKYIKEFRGRKHVQNTK